MEQNIINQNSPSLIKSEDNIDNTSCNAIPLKFSKLENKLLESNDGVTTINTGNDDTQDKQTITSSNSPLEENVKKETNHQDDIIIKNIVDINEFIDQKNIEECVQDISESPNQELKEIKDETCCTINQKKIQFLEGALSEVEKKSVTLENRLKETLRKFSEQNVTIKSEFIDKVDKITRKYELADRDKQSMVIKYANSEKEVIIVKKQLNKLEKNLKDANRDKETLQKNTRTLLLENTKKTNAYDKKVQEYGQLNRQLDKLKDELNAREIKAKWREHKLQAEIDAHKETQEKLDRELVHKKGHEDEMANVKREAAQLVETTKTDELSRGNILEKLYNETKAKVIMVDQKNTDLSSTYNAVRSELNVLKDIYSTQEDELSILRTKVIKYESEREESEKLVTSLQAEITSSKTNETNLSRIVSNSSGLSEQLNVLKKEYIVSCETVIDLKEKLSERESEFLLNQQHENELLEFTQKISDKNAVLQSQLSGSKAKIEEIQSENEKLKQEFCQMKNENINLAKELSEFKCSQETEVNSFKETVETLEKENSKLKTLVSDMKNELMIQQRKYQNIIKDSGKEVIKLKTKLEAIELKSETIIEDGDLTCDSERNSPFNTAGTHETLSRSSNTSSTTSLNNIDGSNCTVISKNNSYEEPLSYKLLLEKLLKLQRRQMKKEEKIEFLEDHVVQLLDELKRKSKILHHYFLKEEPGALSSHKSDDAKAQIMKKGGIMASVYGSSLKDNSMTLELSLEINKKLEAVLEDTLLRNITLKENLNTLADEVAKSTQKVRA